MYITIAVCEGVFSSTDGIDYVVTQSLLTFSPGDSTAGCFTVQINDDMVAESDETFSLFLMSNTEDFQLITVTIRGIFTLM